MGTGSKTRNEFTEDNLGEGKSSGIYDEKGKFGQTIKCAYPQDNVHGMKLEDERGGSFRGGPDNLGHSLRGASAVQDGPGAAGKTKSTRFSNH